MLDMRKEQDPVGDALVACSCLTHGVGSWNCTSGNHTAIIPREALRERSLLGRLFNQPPRVAGIIVAKERRPHEVQVFCEGYLALCERVANILEEKFRVEILVRLFREETRFADRGDDGW